MRTVPTWNQYFINIAEVVATRSKDPNTQVGCLIINQNNHIVGTGYNGMIQGIEETETLWQRPIKHDYVVHAEANAITHCLVPLKGNKLYCTLYPCKNCAKLIATAGLKSVFYKHHSLNGNDYLDTISQEIFAKAGIEVVQIK